MSLKPQADCPARVCRVQYMQPEQLLYAADALELYAADSYKVKRNTCCIIQADLQIINQVDQTNLLEGRSI